MKLALQITGMVAILVISAGIALCLWDLHGAILNANGAITESRAVIARINSQDGPITETDKLLLAMKSTTVHADMAIAHEDDELGRYDEYISGMADDVHNVSTQLAGTANTLSGTASAITETAHSASDMFGLGQDAIRGFSPLLARSTETVGDLDDLLKRPSLTQTIDGLGQTSENAGKITGDLYDFEHKYLNPPPCTTAKCRFGRIFNSIGPLVGIGSGAVDIYHAFSPLNVHVTNP